MLLEQAKAIFAIARGDYKEIVINGHCVFKEQEKPSADESRLVSTYARSLLKPWQFLTADSFGKEKYWAIGLASHAGETRHLSVLNELAEAEELAFADLRCPAAYPSNVPAMARLMADKRPKERVFHNCSGKHLTFLAACRNRKLSKDYLDLDHPLQEEVGNQIEKKVGRKLSWAIDGCGLVTPHFSIGEQMLLWEELALAKDARTELLRQLWLQSPDLVGGEGRLDTEIVKAGGGQVLAKEGADGLVMVQTLPKENEKVQGCYIKLNSGYNPSYLGLALWIKLSQNKTRLNGAMSKVLQYLEVKKDDWVPNDQRLQTLT